MSFWVPGMTLEIIERIAILQAYKWYHQNKTQTATSLGIAIRTLDAKLEKYATDDRLEAEREQADRNTRDAIQTRFRGVYAGIDATRAPQQAPSSSTITGPRMESIANAPAQHALPLSESKEVQELLPTQHAPRNIKRRS